MTHQDLRDLLHDQVADLEATDLTAGVWTDAVRRRRRGRLAAAGATALVTVLVVAGAAVVRDRMEQQPTPRPEPSGPPPWVTETAPASPTSADAEYQDLPVWWSPDLAEERELPWIDDSPLPRHIDLTVDLPELGTTGIPFDRAVAAFGSGRRVVLVGPDGSLRRVPVELPAPADDPDGNPTSRYGPWMLAADGRSLVVRQGDGRARLDIATATWSDLEEEADGVPLGPPVLDVPSAQQNPVGIAKTSEGSRTAQAWGMGPGIPVRDAGRYFSAPSYAVVSGGTGGGQVLAFMTGVDEVRFKDSPTVAGWLDADTVVYESVAEGRDLLVAWDVGTRTFHRVTSATPGWQAAFARLDGGR